MRSLLRSSLPGAAALVIMLFVLIPGMVLAQGCYLPLNDGCSWRPNGVSFGLGWITATRGADIKFSTKNQTIGSLSGLRHSFDMHGIAFNVAMPVRGGGPLGLFLGFEYDFVYLTTSYEEAQIAGSNTLTRTWKAQPQQADVRAGFTLDFTSTISGVAGFRYQNFQTNFMEPNIGLTFIPNGLDTADFTINLYSPYIGVVFNSGPRGPGPGPSIRAGVTGIPVFLGNVDFRETIVGSIAIGGQRALGFQGSNTIGQGYFADFFADVSVTTLRCVELGAYARYDVMDAISHVNIGDRNASLPNVDYNFDFQKRFWTFGGRLTIPF
jgi:hypothetical protein